MKSNPNPNPNLNNPTLTLTQTRYVRSTSCMLLFLSKGYFRSTNCLRELRATIDELRPFVLAHDI